MNRIAKCLTLVLFVTVGACQVASLPPEEVSRSLDAALEGLEYSLQVIPSEVPGGSRFVVRSAVRNAGLASATVTSGCAGALAFHEFFRGDERIYLDDGWGCAAVMQDIEIGPGQTVTQEWDYPAVAGSVALQPGTYEVRADWLVSPEPRALTATFRVR